MVQQYYFIKRVRGRGDSKEPFYIFFRTVSSPSWRGRGQYFNVASVVHHFNPQNLIEKPTIPGTSRKQKT